jgi:Fic family protein
LINLFLIAALVRDAVNFVNVERGLRSSLERAAYVLWRFNWIHPFAGGNGRTSRALAYFIVCVDNGAMLPGEPTMPHLIYERRDDYIAALRAADASVLDDTDATPDVSVMCDLLRDVLTRQLAHAIDSLAKPK